MNAPKPHTTAISLTRPFVLEAGYCYKANLDGASWGQELAKLGDSNTAPRHSRTIVLEDGKPLGPAHIEHRMIAKEGNGRYSHWGSTIYFSSSDNTDPNINERDYSLAIHRDFLREQRFVKALAEFMNERLVEMGQEASGFFEYYASFVERGKVFSDLDNEVSRFILQKASHYQRYIEVGAGIGQLDALLASQGLKTIGVEVDQKRVAAANALRNYLAQEFPEIRENMSIIEASFPATSVTDAIDKDTAIIFTNLIGQAHRGEDAIQACANAGAIIIDLCRFGFPRTTLDEWRDLILRIRALGFPYVDVVASWGEATSQNEISPTCGRILHFYRTPQLRPRDDR